MLPCSKKNFGARPTFLSELQNQFFETLLCFKTVNYTLGGFDGDFTNVSPRQRGKSK
jgi:hypothetical protein